MDDTPSTNKLTEPQITSPHNVLYNMNTKEEETCDEDDVEYNPSDTFGNLDNFIRYIYAEYKFDIPDPCIHRHFHPDIEWIFGHDMESSSSPSYSLFNALHSVCPLIGKFVGHEKMKYWLKLMLQSLEILKWQVNHVTVQGDHLTVLLHGEYQVKNTGKKYAVEETHHHIIKNWEIMSVKILFDLQSALDGWV